MPAHALELKLVAFSSRPDAAELTRVVVRLSGPIAKDDFERLFGNRGAGETAALLDARRWAPRSIVYLNSTGGNVAEAMRIGREFRNRGMWTAIQPNDACASACVALMMGGARRWMDTSAIVIIHKPEITEGGPPDPRTRARILDALKYRLSAFADDLGVDKGLVANMYATPFDLPRRIRDSEAATWRLASDFGDPFATFMFTEPVAFPASLAKR
jgi:hypothetical protein